MGEGGRERGTLGGSPAAKCLKSSSGRGARVRPEQPISGRRDVRQQALIGERVRGAPERRTLHIHAGRSGALARPGSPSRVLGKDKGLLKVPGRSGLRGAPLGCFDMVWKAFPGIFLTGVGSDTCCGDWTEMPDRAPERTARGAPICRSESVSLAVGQRAPRAGLWVRSFWYPAPHLALQEHGKSSRGRPRRQGSPQRKLPPRQPCTR